MNRFIYFCLILIGLPLLTLSITTIHHDKPEKSKISTIPVSKPREKTIEKPPLNTTLSTSERQKRLLPYTNFYLSQDYNQPPTGGSFQGAPPRFEIVVPKENQQSSQYNTGHREILYQNKYTPFLESNALPGGFTPMLRGPQQEQPQRIKVQYVNQDKPIPNYSAIYDKLSQLKLVQTRGRIPTYLAANYRFNPARFVYRKPQRVNYVPVNTYEENYNNKPIQPTRTFVETYTATNIDIPTANGDSYNNQNYEQIPPPNNDNQKPFVQQHIAFEIPQNSYAVQNDYNEQYNNQPSKEIVRKPFIIVQSQKAIESHEKEYSQTLPKPIIILQQRKPSTSQKPIPITIVDGNRYIPVTKYNKLPQQYIQEQVEIQEEAPQQQQVTIPQQPEYVEATPQYNQPPNYEEFPPQSTVPITEQPVYYQKPATEDTNTLGQILKQLQNTNTLPQTLTADNIDNSIKTLVRILGALRKQKNNRKPVVVAEPPQYEEIENEAGVGISGHPEEVPGTITQSFPGITPEGGTPGKPGVDYPALSSIPQTSFNCKTQRYKGFFGDPDTHCQVWHYCDLNGGQASFLCPNGTIFSQVALTCDWWYNVKCSTTTQLYVLNERLYKYIIPLSPKFPEDYSGPLVDKYLALKFQEMEEKMKKERKGKQKGENNESEDEQEATSSKESEEDVSESSYEQEQTNQNAASETTEVSQEKN